MGQKRQTKVLADIQLITIDLDDTLWPCRPTIIAAEAALYAWLERHAQRLSLAYDIDALRQHRAALKRRCPEIAHDLTELRRRSLHELLVEFGYDPALADTAVALFQTHRNRVQPYADAPVCLRRLARRYRLVSLSNGNAQVEQTALKACFHHSLSAADVGASKPAPALFLAAMAWAGSEPASALHVGDDPLLDIQAARATGMRTVWVNRSNMTWPAAVEAPDAVVSDLYQLNHWLESQA
jgi:putative hydrolase of the HAD superfamily